MKCSDADLVKAGSALMRLDLNEADTALRIFEAALECNPDNKHAAHNIGTLLTRGGKPEQALTHLAHAVALNPNESITWGELATAYRDMRDFKAAMSCARHAVNLAPNAKLRYQLAGLNELIGDYDEAEVCYKKSLQLSPDPETAYAWGMIKMLKRDFSFGLPLYEERLLAPGVQQNKVHSVLDIIDIPPETVTRVIVVYEQGVGDLFQMARYAPLLRDAYPAAQITLVCPDRLVPIMKRFYGFHEVTETLQYTDTPGIILLSSMSLMYWAMIKGQDIYQPPAKINTDDLGGPSGVRIGVCWAGNPDHKLDKYRSIPKKLFERLSVRFGCFSLQFDPTKQSVNGWEPTLATINQMALIITCDTAIAHLAGSIGKPVWLLLSANPDWRWSLGSETTPWYPNMILFRQRELLNWEPVIDTVCEKLEAIYGAK